MNYFNNLQNMGTYIFGDMSTVCIIMILVFIVALIMIGLEVKFAFLASMPVAIAFTQMGWMYSWVAGIYWIIICGFFMYQIWTMLQAEYF